MADGVFTVDGKYPTAIPDISGGAGTLFARDSVVIYGANGIPAQFNSTGAMVSVGNVGSLTTDSGFPVKIGAVYNTVAPAPTNGQRVDAQADFQGDLMVSLGTLLNGEDPVYGVLKTVEGEWSYLNITTKTTSLVKSGPGIFGGVMVNKAGSADTIQGFDGLTATGLTTGIITAPTTSTRFMYNIPFITGLTVVTGGTTAGDYTILFK